MKPPYILALAAALLLTGCAIPIPPTGPDAGSYGWINVGYTPNIFAAIEKPLPAPNSTSK